MGREEMGGLRGLRKKASGALRDPASRGMKWRDGTGCGTSSSNLCLHVHAPHACAYMHNLHSHPPLHMHSIDIWKTLWKYEAGEVQIFRLWSTP